MGHCLECWFTHKEDYILYLRTCFQVLMSKPSLCSLNGQCHEIFCFRFFSWIIFPQAPENNEKFRTALIVYSGAWGKQIHEKNLKSKISWHCPFKLRSKVSLLFNVLYACAYWVYAEISSLKSLKLPTNLNEIVRSWIWLLFCEVKFKITKKRKNVK